MPRPSPPLDIESLERLALHYVGRYATTRAKLRAYLKRKVTERGWQGGSPDVAALAERFAAAGYVDDAAFAEARTGALQRRGYGARRIGQALRHAGVEETDRAALDEQVEAGAQAAALRFAQRRRIGPFASTQPDPALRSKQIAAMIRAGHDFALARRIVDARPGAEIPFGDD